MNSILTFINDRKKTENTLRWAEGHKRLISQSANALLAAEDPQRIIQQICHNAMDFLDCQVFFNFLVVPEEKRLRLNAYYGIAADQAKEIEWLDFGSAVCGCVARDGQRITADNILKNKNPQTDLIAGYGVRCYCCHPLLFGKKEVIGTISFGSSTRDRFTKKEISVMTDVTDMVAIAMYRKRTEESLRQSEQRLNIALEKDITERKRSEEELEKRVVLRTSQIANERQRLYSVMETLPVYVILLTPDYHVSFANKFFRERFGDSGGKRCYEYLFNRQAPCDNCETYKVLKDGNPHHSEWNGPDGRTYDIYDFPFIETDGSTHIMEVGIDITERKNAESALLEAQREIDRAKRLSDIGTLAATVAHELRNPLAAINIAAHNIKRKAAATPLFDRHLQNIVKKVAESDQIIDNLLFYSRIKPPDYETINLNAIIDECTDSAEGHCKGKKIIIERRIGATDGVSIEADSLQVKELFINILNNSIDALPPAGGTVSILTKNNDNSVDIIFEDNGNGIAKTDLARVFDPFFTTKAKGTGLGLSVCKQIVKLHGGNIDIKSDIGKGTKIIINLYKRRV